MLTPAETKQILIMRAAGHSIASIAETVGVSATAIKSTVKAHKITKGSAMAELINAAQEKLKSDYSLTDLLKQSIAGMVADDLAIVKRLRENILLTLERLEECSETTPTGRARTLASLATSLTVTQSIWRKSLQASRIEESAPASELQALPIYFMTPDQEAEVRAAANSEGFGVHVRDDVFSTDGDDPDLDVITEELD